MCGSYKVVTCSYVSYDYNKASSHIGEKKWDAEHLPSYRNQLLNAITLTMVQRIIYVKLKISKFTWLSPVQGIMSLIKETHRKLTTCMEKALKGFCHFGSYRKWILNGER